MSGSQSSQALPSYTCLILGFLKCLPFRMFLSLARRLILSLTCLVNEIEFLLTSRSCSSGHSISCCCWIGSLLFLCPQPTKTDTKVNGKMTKNTVKGSSSTWTEAKCIRVSGLLIFPSVVQWKTLVVTRHQHQQLTPFPRSVHSFVMFLTRFLSWRGDPRRARQWKALFQATTANVHT